MTDDFLTVRKGDPITAEVWNKMRTAAQRSRVLLGGENMRAQILPHGTLLNAKHSGGWDHPWRVTASGEVAMISPGTINGGKPTMLDRHGNEVPLTNRPPPLLQFQNNLFNDRGEGWIALELKLDEKYKAITTAHVIQASTIVGSEMTTNNPYFYFGLPGLSGFRARYPLAKLKRLGKGAIEVYQVAMFNLNHKAKPPSPGGSALPRHFFWPA